LQFDVGDFEHLGTCLAKPRGNPNRRTVKLQKAFEKLKPVEQQFVLKQIEGLAGQKN
jgi:hypothetical protein